MCSSKRCDDELTLRRWLRTRNVEANEAQDPHGAVKIFNRTGNDTLALCMSENIPIN